MFLCKVQPSAVVQEFLSQLPLCLRKKGVDLSERRFCHIINVLQVAAWVSVVFLMRIEIAVFSFRLEQRLQTRMEIA